LEAAEYAEVSTTMIYRAARSGLLASGRVGNRYRFKHADIDRWISTKEEGKQ
jgi:excisionase family DNA binding protein